MAPVYRMRVVSHLDNEWSAWLGGFSIQVKHDGTSVLTGHVDDQAALHGVLTKLRDLGLTLLEVK